MPSASGHPNRSSGGYNPYALGRFHRNDTRGGVNELTDAVMMRGDKTIGFPVRGSTRNKRIRFQVEQRRCSMTNLTLYRHNLSIYAEIADDVNANVPKTGWVDEQIQSPFDPQLRHNEVAHG